MENRTRRTQLTILFENILVNSLGNLVVGLLINNFGSTRTITIMLSGLIFGRFFEHMPPKITSNKLNLLLFLYIVQLAIIFLPHYFQPSTRFLIWIVSRILQVLELKLLVEVMNICSARIDKRPRFMLGVCNNFQKDLYHYPLKNTSFY